MGELEMSGKFENMWLKLDSLGAPIKRWYGCGGGWVCVLGVRGMRLLNFFLACNLKALKQD